MHKPFDNEIENKKYESLYNTISNKLDKMILSTDSEIMRYMEIVCSTLLLEINKKLEKEKIDIFVKTKLNLWVRKLSSLKVSTISY